MLCHLLMILPHFSFSLFQSATSPPNRRCAASKDAALQSAALTQETTAARCKSIEHGRPEFATSPEKGRLEDSVHVAGRRAAPGRRR